MKGINRVNAVSKSTEMLAFGKIGPLFNSFNSSGRAVHNG